MKVCKFVAVLLLAVGMFSTTAIAQDDCATAVAAPGPVDPCLDTTPTGPLGGCTGGGGVDDVWLTFVAPATSTRVRTDIGSAGTDSNFLVYSSSDGTCAGVLTVVGCTEDISGSNFLSNTCVGGLTVGATYFVRLGDWADGACGPYVVTISGEGTCGNGTVECGEACDDSNTVDGVYDPFCIEREVFSDVFCFDERLHTSSPRNISGTSC
jgi:hypothetical protein